MTCIGSVFTGFVTSSPDRTDGPCLSVRLSACLPVCLMAMSPPLIHTLVSGASCGTSGPLQWPLRLRCAGIGATGIGPGDFGKITHTVNTHTHTHNLSVQYGYKRTRNFIKRPPSPSHNSTPTVMFFCILCCFLYAVLGRNE